MFRIEYSQEAVGHLRALTACEQATVLDTVEEQLLHDPNVETRNRKPLRPNSVAPWELRIGNVRVYYDFSVDPEPVVFVQAIGVKSHNRVIIGGEEIEL